jgi:hypothetical protein
MTTILCKSPFLASELALHTGKESTLMFPSVNTDGTDRPEDFPSRWLAECLLTNRVSLVLYEPRFFVDPSSFRALSPDTRFVVIASPGDEQNTQEALVCGACAVIDKPLLALDVCGVLSLVSQ